MTLYRYPLYLHMLLFLHCENIKSVFLQWGRNNRLWPYVMHCMLRLRFERTCLKIVFEHVLANVYRETGFFLYWHFLYTWKKKSKIPVSLMKRIPYSTAKQWIFCLSFFQNSRGRGVQPQLYSLMLICSNSLISTNDIYVWKPTAIIVFDSLTHFFICGS